MRKAVIVAYGRSAVGRAPTGTLKHTRPEDLCAQVINGVLAKVPQVRPEDIEDLVIGNAFPECEQGFNLARVVGLRAGLPDSVAGQTVNRFCSSGLQTIATVANSIMTGQMEIAIAGGVESMSIVPMLGNRLTPNPYLMEKRPEAYMAMGLTAEVVAEKYGVTREMQDEFAVESHRRSAKAQTEGKFTDEIIAVDAVKVAADAAGRLQNTTVRFDRDEGIRFDASMESMSKLKPIFKKNGTVTAGNASQMSDGAAAVILMSDAMAEKLGLKPLAIFRSFAAVGVAPEVMGIGPIAAIPKALKIAGLTKEDLDLVELNEAFASQAIACMKQLDLDPDITNVNGGAIAMGHPLGCTGSFLTAKLLSELKRRQGKYGLVSMCIGGGMGAAGIFEYCR